MRRQFAPGNPISFDHFISTSSRIGGTVAGRVRLVLLPLPDGQSRGKDISMISGNPHEQERIFAPVHNRFIVQSLTQNPPANGDHRARRWEVVLQELPPP